MKKNVVTNERAQDTISNVDGVVDVRATVQQAVLTAILDDIDAVNKKRANNYQKPIRDDDDNEIISDILKKYGLTDDCETISNFFDDYDKYTNYIALHRIRDAEGDDKHQLARAKTILIDCVKIADEIASHNYESLRDLERECYESDCDYATRLVVSTINTMIGHEDLAIDILDDDDMSDAQKQRLCKIYTAIARTGRELELELSGGNQVDIMDRARDAFLLMLKQQVSI